MAPYTHCLRSTDPRGHFEISVGERARNSARRTEPSERFVHGGEPCVDEKRKETAARLVLSDTGLDVRAFEDPEGLDVARQSGYSGPSQFPLQKGALRTHAAGHLLANLFLHNGEIVGVGHADTLRRGGDYGECGATTGKLLTHNLRQ